MYGQDRGSEHGAVQPALRHLPRVRGAGEPAMLLRHRCLALRSMHGALRKAGWNSGLGPAPACQPGLLQVRLQCADLCQRLDPQLGAGVSRSCCCGGRIVGLRALPRLLGADKEGDAHSAGEPHEAGTLTAANPRATAREERTEAAVAARAPAALHPAVRWHAAPRGLVCALWSRVLGEQVPPAPGQAGVGCLGTGLRPACDLKLRLHE
mmetsp:Transcript_45253/g.104624  ORF Transcript_45253/g.104624 Transcript_45253/m.104624 type:complete len:209 (+) Transcript_45253:476-1102(+)